MERLLSRKRIRAWRGWAASFGVSVLSLALLGVTEGRDPGVAPVVFADGFENAVSPADGWWLGQAITGRYWVDTIQARSGERSFALRITEADRGCGAACQRNEIRVRPAARVDYGEESEVSFSFRLESEAGRDASARWISGQWKQQNDESPFLAQRFDGGVFTITVQDADCRVVIAAGAGARLPVGATIDTSKEVGLVGSPDMMGASCVTDIAVESAPGATLPDPFEGWVDMTYRVRGGRDGQGLVEVWADGRFIARATGSIGFAEPAGSKEYFKFGIYRSLTPGVATAYLDDFEMKARVR